ncbi:MAG: hypothetical protein FJ194_17250 [Gammaproteobacteria bacterium]|nr:hypothetical protein [Gammaproteobacteria bacterium]
MSAFRGLLAILLVTVVVYTVPVIAEHGLLSLMPAFFGDMAKMGWPGQFNLDFSGFLILSALWAAWRNHFSAPGLGLAVLAFFFGIPFLTTYLLILSFQSGGDIKVMLLGAQRARS